MIDFWISLSSLTESPVPFRIETTRAWWDEADLIADAPGLRLLEPFVLELQGHRLGRRLLFRGELRGAVELECGSCTEPFEYRYAQPVELLLEPLPTGAEPPEGGIELDPEEESLGRYAGERVGFEPLISETLMLTWPMAPRCREDCQGLCPDCGRNRNRGPCGCRGSGAPGPFDALAALLPGRRGSREDED